MIWTWSILSIGFFHLVLQIANWINLQTEKVRHSTLCKYAVFNWKHSQYMSLKLAYLEQRLIFLFLTVYSIQFCLLPKNINPKITFTLLKVISFRKHRWFFNSVTRIVILSSTNYSYLIRFYLLRMRHKEIIQCIIINYKNMSFECNHRYAYSSYRNHCAQKNKTNNCCNY